MPIEQSTLKHSSAFILSASGFLFVVCELVVGIQLWSKRGLHRFAPAFYFLPLLLLLPIVGGLALRRRLRKWESSGEISNAASAQIDLNVSELILFSYMLFLFVAQPR